MRVDTATRSTGGHLHQVAASRAVQLHNSANRPQKVAQKWRSKPLKQFRSRRKCLMLLEPVVGFEPTTVRLQIGCSTTELNWPTIGTIRLQSFFSPPSPPPQDSFIPSRTPPPGNKVTGAPRGQAAHRARRPHTDPFPPPLTSRQPFSDTPLLLSFPAEAKGIPDGRVPIPLSRRCGTAPSRLRSGSNSRQSEPVVGDCPSSPVQDRIRRAEPARSSGRPPSR